MSDPALSEAVAYLKEVNRDQRHKLTAEAPTGFLPRRWMKYVTAREKGEPPTVARPYYELALLATLNERLSRATSPSLIPGAGPTSRTT